MAVAAVHHVLLDLNESLQTVLSVLDAGRDAELSTNIHGATGTLAEHRHLLGNGTYDLVRIRHSRTTEMERILIYLIETILFIYQCRRNGQTCF